MLQGDREWMTLIECASAVGIQLPVFYIYAGTVHYKGWHNSEAIGPGTVLAYTDNGWTKDYLGLEWLRNHFSKFAIPSRLEKTDSFSVTTTLPTTTTSSTSTV